MKLSSLLPFIQISWPLSHTPWSLTNLYCSFISKSYSHSNMVQVCTSSDIFFSSETLFWQKANPKKVSHQPVLSSGLRASPEEAKQQIHSHRSWIVAPQLKPAFALVFANPPVTLKEVGHVDLLDAPIFSIPYTSTKRTTLLEAKQLKRA